VLIDLGTEDLVGMGGGITRPPEYRPAIESNHLAAGEAWSPFVEAPTDSPFSGRLSLKQSKHSAAFFALAT